MKKNDQNSTKEAYRSPALEIVFIQPACMFATSPDTNSGNSTFEDFEILDPQDWD